ncbi:type II toxin-antitoxin system VapC family toxin [Sinosporangium siamense]|uniref:PIN domain-containing protein n=1 Tax=Sinosporangium siamense TaxID=1367973 RepID=A0A919V5K2_9ACTN|nr:type II toxin-antitoxin system VapC family toxin [Sinosporangium siamense]GII90961.1 hypothetical protein Ssi02_11920 [Sinosporangium siamense]
MCDEDLAVALHKDFIDLPIERHPGRVLTDRMWELKSNFTACDAAYIALAELLDCPLVTGDAKLIGPHRATVDLYA